MKSTHYALVALVLLSGAQYSRAQERIVEYTPQMEAGVLLVETNPVSLPMLMDSTGQDHSHLAVFPDLVRFQLPVAGYLYGVEYELLDSIGRAVPNRILHHFNIIDPNHRELFLPISRRIFAAGQETGAYKMPKALAGIPFEEGDRWILSVMLHNPTSVAWAGVKLKVRLLYTRKGLPWPLAHVIPFQMDTRFPTGDKSFDLPPGPFSQSWEGSPVTEGRVIAIGSHLHEMATRIFLEDVTEGEIVWAGEPVYDEYGRLESTTRGEFYRSFGVLLNPDHVYRVTVEYVNPTNETIPDGGMGVIAGLVIPSEPDFDFSTVSSDSLYAVDRDHFMRAGMMMEMEEGMDEEMNHR